MKSEETGEQEGVKLKAPTEDVQRILMKVLQENLDVLNLHKLGEVTGLKMKARHFVERNAPFKDGREWLLFKTAVNEEVAIMENLVKAIKQIKTRI